MATKNSVPKNEQEAVATFGDWLKSQLSLITDDATLKRGMARKDKSFDECAQWIYEGVKKSGCIGCHTPDDEIIGMAIHYFTEDKVTKDDLSLSNVSHYVKNATPKADKPKTDTPKKASVPSKATVPTKKASIPQVIDIDDDFDVD